MSAPLWIMVIALPIEIVFVVLTVRNNRSTARRYKSVAATYERVAAISEQIVVDFERMAR